MNLNLAFTIAIAGLITTIVGAFLLLRPGRRSADRVPRCGRCSYNLTGSDSNRCPECGGLFIEVGVRIAEPAPGATPRRVAAVALLMVAAFVGVSLLLSSLAAGRAATARAQAVAAHLNAVQQAVQAKQKAALAKPQPSTSSQPDSQTND